MRFRDFPNKLGASGYWNGRTKVVKMCVNDQWGGSTPLRGIEHRYTLWVYGEKPPSIVVVGFPDNTVLIARERPA